MILFAIDPGPTESGWVFYNCDTGLMESCGVSNNFVVRAMLQHESHQVVAIEQITNYGMVAGQTLFDSCEWTGRFIECARSPAFKIPRPDVLKHLTGRRSGKTTDLIYVLTKRYGEKGTKKAPGPLYGITRHAWDALALATTYKDTIYDTEKNQAEAQEAYRGKAISAKEVEAASGYFPRLSDERTKDEAD